MDEIRRERKQQVALGYRILAAQRWGDLGEAHMKARRAVPISAGAARFAKTDLTGHAAGRVAFGALVARHIADPSVVFD